MKCNSLLCEKNEESRQTQQAGKADRQTDTASRTSRQGRQTVIGLQQPTDYRLL